MATAPAESLAVATALLRAPARTGPYSFVSTKEYGEKSDSRGRIPLENLPPQDTKIRAACLMKFVAFCVVLFCLWVNLSVILAYGFCFVRVFTSRYFCAFGGCEGCGACGLVFAGLKFCRGDPCGRPPRLVYWLSSPMVFVLFKFLPRDIFNEPTVHCIWGVTEYLAAEQD